MKKLTRDDTEHGKEYYLASDVDALMAQPAPVQEPVGMYRNKCADGSPCLHGCHTNEPCYTSPQPAPVQQSCYCPNCEALSKELTELKAQPSQEPVAWISENAGLYHGKPDESLNPLPLYLAPPPQPKPWVSLTPKAIEDMAYQGIFLGSVSEITAEIDAKLRELNEAPPQSQTAWPNSQIEQPAPVQQEPEFFTHNVEQPHDWSEWVCPDPKGYLMKCCDCGLVHEAEFGVVRYKSETEREDCEPVEDPNLQAVFRMRRSEQWTPEDTAHRAGGSPMEQPEQEPIGEAHLMQEGFTHCIWSESCVPVGTKFYTTPPQRTWVGLTDEDMADITSLPIGTCAMMLKVEAKLKEKNDKN